MKDNVKKTDFGYEITWIVTEAYTGKILVFENPGVKTPMLFHKEQTKSWFINTGRFRMRWIDTKDGKLYQSDIQEGSVFHIPQNMPHSIESLSAGASISQISDKNMESDNFIIISPDNIGDGDAR